ncbi:apolipoprotein N-acyltransferase [Actinokineospora sp. UTMC 2448]|uniref:apolipoprotein N-acyltransferase n=1 Tax=Actinokineospora sp. UTMC 2448 TaxID=2268449 RepID=UPI002164C3AC|nr:apolipoprotein N-acyltransferase [Actinokineospora sp. UTMC 2448]UVS79347.1 Apolipoprotein N-acyltransferase [Actinokineospora sp. UTMC 2448]
MAVPTAVPAADQPAPAPRARVLVIGRTVAALAGGLAVFLAFPPRPTWWLAPLGFAVLGLLLRTARARAGFGYGFAFGLGMMVPLLAWTGEFVGLIAWLPLAAVEALLVALSTAAIAVVGRLPGWPLWAALLWTAGETLRAVFPFGGFPWAKVAFSQPEGWYLPLAALGGTPLIAFAVALTGFGLAALVHTRRPALALVAVAPLLAGLAATPLVGTDAQAGEVTVAAIQGNVPRAGLDFNAQRRAVLDNHVARTEQLAADIAAGRAPRPDLVIWPENASDIDPYRNPDARAAINRAADAVGVPIAVGSVLVDPDGRPRNTVILWTPEQGPVAEYTKRQLQPFGETMPMRDFFRLFTDYVDRANNFRAGEAPGVFTVDGIRLAVATCYEVAFDDIVRENVALGANLIAVPTNNATFGRTEMTYQQLAMDRVRAVEHGRAVVVAATSGVSAIVAPDGSITRSTGLFTPDALVERVPLRTETTMAHRLGAWPEWVMVVAGLAALAAALVAGGRARRTGTTP